MQYASSIVFPLIISVAYELNAIVEPQPNVFLISKLYQMFLIYLKYSILNSLTVFPYLYLEFHGHQPILYLHFLSFIKWTNISGPFIMFNDIIMVSIANFDDEIKSIINILLIGPLVCLRDPKFSDGLALCNESVFH
jgi:hypothetical protein